MVAGKTYERTRPVVTEPTEGEYQGRPTLTLPIDDRRDFTFGFRKAKAILEHLGAIRKFVENAERDDED